MMKPGRPFCKIMKFLLAVLSFRRIDMAFFCLPKYEKAIEVAILDGKTGNGNSSFLKGSACSRVKFLKCSEKEAAIFLLTSAFLSILA